MADIRPFRALRPAERVASRIAALPYDVYTSSEARQIVEENPLSFLKIDRAETQFPSGTDPYEQKVYERARDTLKEMEAAGEFLQEKEPCYYVYAQTMAGRTQAGVVCCVSIDDYLNQIVRKHENTREDKEQDRIRHVDVCSAHTGPIFLAYRRQSGVQRIVEAVMREEALYDFASGTPEAEKGMGREVQCLAGEKRVVHHQVWPGRERHRVRHQVWRIRGKDRIRELTEQFREIPCLYIADGHHRAASAVKAGLKRRTENPAYNGTEEFNFFLAVLFPAEDLKIYDYNRVIHKISGEELPEKLNAFFEVRLSESGRVHPTQKGEMGLYTGGSWYRLRAKPETGSDDPVDALDVSVLQNTVLGPMLGIEDPKTDERIQFVGGIRGLEELERIVDQEEGAAAFAMYPTSMEELLRVADAGRLMPPKSTWFEPKLLSGLLIHKFER